MILLFYNLALLAALLLGAPWWLFRMATTHKYREGLGERLGRVPTHLLETAAGRPVLWLHAVSVGEVIAASRLIADLDRALPSHCLLISTTTRTGHALASERFGADRVFYCPLDLPWAVRSYLNALHPCVFILAETEFWPNLLSGCFRRSIPVVVVNARVSDRSWPRYLRTAGLWKGFLSRLARVLAQSQTDGARLLALGCNPERLTVAGNLKFDVRATQPSEATRLLQALRHGLRLVVAGSTLDREEAALLEIWPQLLAADPNLALLLAPRHPERFPAVAALLQQSGLTWSKRSDWQAQPAGSVKLLKPGHIVLLDTIGELASAYSLASVAFVGGSLFPAGGHNPLEPAQFGVPIVMGPWYPNFRTITQDLQAHDALHITTPEDLAVTLLHFLTDRAAAQAMGARALEVFDQQAGATARCVAAIQELLAEQPAQILNPTSLVSGHDFSHADRVNQSSGGLQPLSADNPPLPRPANPASDLPHPSSRRFLLPLIPLYRLALWFRERRLGTRAEPIRRLRSPVVSIGNLSTGGAGKTPLTIALAKALAQRGVQVNVLSRGYGRTSQSPTRVQVDGTAQQFGDEPLLIARDAGVPVYVAARRYDAGLLAEGDASAIAFLGEQFNPVVHLLDDGFQHRQLHRDADILLLSRDDLADRLLPAGNLREPLTAMRRASAVAIPAGEPELEATLKACGWQGPLWRLHRTMEVPDISGPVAAFCGIARPQQFFAGLDAAGLDVVLRKAFPDHHPYTAADLAELAAAAQTAGVRTLLTTEKDRARLGARLSSLSASLSLQTVPLRIAIEDEDEAIAWLLARISSAASHSRL